MGLVMGLSCLLLVVCCWLSVVGRWSLFVGGGGGGRCSCLCVICFSLVVGLVADRGCRVDGQTA